MNQKRTEKTKNGKDEIMRRSLVCLLLLIMAVASNGYAADLVIGNWEGTGTDYDGWGNWVSNAVAAPTNFYHESSVGVTKDSQSLKVVQSGWSQALALDLTSDQRVALTQHNAFRIDFSVATGTGGGELQIAQFVLNTAATGFTALTLTNNVSTNNYFDLWSGSPARTMTLTAAYDPCVFEGTTPGYAQIIIAINGVSPGDTFYFDNARLVTSGAQAPSPANEATDVNLTPTLSWTAGEGATSHDVYFSTGSTPAFVQHQTGTTYSPGTLGSNTTYYWRIDEVNSVDGNTTGDIWHFTTVTAPGKASNPSPADRAGEANLAPTLSWTAGARAASHQVYFGTTSPGTLQGDQTETTFNPGTLDANTTYYWRIDENDVNGTTTGDVWKFTTPALTIKKCTVTAGKTQASDANLLQDATDINHIKDSFTASGTAILPTDREDITNIDVYIVSGDGNVIYSETIDFNDHTDVFLKHGKYSYSHKITKADPNGAVTSLKMDFSKTPKTFAITAKNINLTGLACPVQLELVMGDNLIFGEANEAVVNGKKLIPTRLMRMYKDTLVVTKAKAKNSTKASSDTLSVTGEIAVKDINNTNMNEPNLAVVDVNFLWGDQTFTVRDGNFVAAKTGHKYTCKKVQSDANEGVVTAKFDLDKCTFTVSVKDANNLDIGQGDNIVPFGLDFNDFSETADVNVVTRRSY